MFRQANLFFSLVREREKEKELHWHIKLILIGIRGQDINKDAQRECEGENGKTSYTPKNNFFDIFCTIVLF